MVSDPGDKDIKIEPGEDVGQDDKIKAGVKALAKKPLIHIHSYFCYKHGPKILCQ